MQLSFWLRNKGTTNDTMKSLRRSRSLSSDMRNSYNSKILDDFEFPRFSQRHGGLHISGLSTSRTIDNVMSQPTSISLGSLSFGSGYIASPTIVRKQRGDKKHGGE